MYQGSWNYILSILSTVNSIFDQNRSESRPKMKTSHTLQRQEAIDSYPGRSKSPEGDSEIESYVWFIQHS